MKVGIVVPYSWSYWGGVNEHVELKVEALRRLGIETRTVIGHDPPGSFTRVLHPRHGRHGRPPADVIPVGRSVIVPANGALPNIVLSPSAIMRVKRALHRDDGVGERPRGRDVPCVRAALLVHVLQARLGLPDGQDRSSDRRHRGGA